MAKCLVKLTRAASAAEIVDHLKSIASDDVRDSMLRYGINIEESLGVPHSALRDISKAVGRNHERALELWASGISEARFIAACTADPQLMDVDTARAWAAEFNSWDIVDGVSDLFVDMDEWQDLVAIFAEDEREFVRRTAFAMICWAVVHRKSEPDATFAAYLPLIEQYADDERNFVKKAVNWALRTIGKRNWDLHVIALACAQQLAATENKTTRWVGRNAAHELTAEKTLAMMEKRADQRRMS